MKTLTARAFLLFLSLFSISAPLPAQRAVVSGQLLEAEPQTLYLIRSRDRINYREWMETVDSFQVKEDGLFHFSFPAGKPDFYQVCVKSGYYIFPNLYLGGGDSLHLVKNWKDYMIPVRYSGDRAGAYGFFARMDSLWRNDSLFKIDRHKMFAMDQDDFLSLMEERKARRRSILDEHFRGHAEWEPIKSLSASAYAYQDAGGYFEYLYYHNYYANDTFLYLKADSSFYGFLQGIDPDPGEFDYLLEYRSFMGRFLDDLFERQYGDLSDTVKWEKGPLLKLELIKEHLKGASGDAALLSMTDNFSFDLALDDFFEQAETLKTWFRDHHADELSYRKFLKILSGFEALRPGSPAPELALPDVNGDTVRLSDFPGKVVYVDFWGTWCYPCLQELPHSLVLQEKLKDEDVVFVFVGLESGEDQLTEWREFIQGQRSFDYAPFLEQRVYPGVHLLSEGQFGNPALRPYKIDYAPTYLLTDRQGRIVSARAPRPSDAELEGVLRGLLED